MSVYKEPNMNTVKNALNYLRNFIESKQDGLYT